MVQLPPWHVHFLRRGNCCGHNRFHAFVGQCHKQKVGLQVSTKIQKEDLSEAGGSTLLRGNYTKLKNITCLTVELSLLVCYNPFCALNVIFRALSTSVWQKSGRFYSDL